MNTSWLQTLVILVVIVIVVATLWTTLYPTIKKAYLKLKSLKTEEKDDKQDQKG